MRNNLFFVETLRATTITAEQEALEDVNSLRKLLNPQAATIRIREFRAVVHAPLGGLVVARHTKTLRLIGMATLVVYQKLEARVGVVESVVVKPEHRGNGIGRALMKEVLRSARGAGLDHLNLTSSPERVEAIALYESLGFKKRDTYCFRLKL